MSRRMMNSTMLEDDFVTSMPVFERFLWIGLILIADDQGRLQDSAALIRSKVFPLDDIPIKQIETGLQAFYVARKVERYVINGKHFIQIVNWWKHQFPQWAGHSSYPPPPGWIDRERYHTNPKDITTVNWDKAGGYVERKLDDYVEGNPGPEKRKEEVKSEDEVKAKPPTPASFSDDPMVSIIATVMGIPPNSNDLPAIKELENMNALEDDIRGGYAWLKSKEKTVSRVSQLVGPTRTAMAKRLNPKGNGSKQSIPDSIPVSQAYPNE